MEEKDIELTERLQKCGHFIYHNSPSGRSQTQVLLYLMDRGEMSQRDLQDELKIQPGSLSELVTKLENKGLIVRSRDEEDRRKVLLSLTAAGMSIAKHRKEAGTAEIRYPNLSDEQKETLTELLDQVISGWKEGSL